MPSAIVTSKGQVTIPMSVRQSLGLNTGCKVDFVKTMNGRYEIIPVTKPVQFLKGFLKKPEEPVSIEKMNKIIAACGVHN